MLSYEFRTCPDRPINYFWIKNNCKNKLTSPVFSLSSQLDSQIMQIPNELCILCIINELNWCILPINCQNTNNVTNIKFTSMVREVLYNSFELIWKCGFIFPSLRIMNFTIFVDTLTYIWSTVLSPETFSSWWIWFIDVQVIYIANLSTKFSSIRVY